MASEVDLLQIIDAICLQFSDGYNCSGLQKVSEFDIFMKIQFWMVNIGSKTSCVHF